MHKARQGLGLALSLFGAGLLAQALSSWLLYSAH